MTSPGGLRAAAGAAGAAETPLRAYDNVLIMRQPGWDMHRSVALAGQVKYPGRYSLPTKTERLSDVIRRAGGLTPEAYSGGVEFYRAYTGSKPTAAERLPQLAGEKAEKRDSMPRSVSERLGINLTEVLEDEKFRDNIILVERRFDLHPRVQPGGHGPGSGQLTRSRGLLSREEPRLVRERGRRVHTAERRQAFVRDAAERGAARE